MLTLVVGVPASEETEPLAEPRNHLKIWRPTGHLTAAPPQCPQVLQESLIGREPLTTTAHLGVKQNTIKIK